MSNDLYKPWRKEVNRCEDQPQHVLGREQSHWVESIAMEGGRTEPRPQVTRVVLGFGKEFGFNSKCYGSF